MKLLSIIENLETITIEEVLKEYTKNNRLLINMGNDYKKKKLEYEVKFNTLVLGETYNKKFKTIKAREQQATIDLKELKEEIITLETETKNLRYTKETYDHLLNLLEGAQ